MAVDVRADRAERVVPSGVRRAPRARYLPIAEHGLIGDLHTELAHETELVNDVPVLNDPPVLDPHDIDQLDANLTPGGRDPHELTRWMPWKTLHVATRSPSSIAPEEPLRIFRLERLQTSVGADTGSWRRLLIVSGLLDRRRDRLWSGERCQALEVQVDLDPTRWKSTRPATLPRKLAIETDIWLPAPTQGR